MLSRKHLLFFPLLLLTTYHHLDEVFTCLANAGLRLNTKKCLFARKSTKVLGHVASKEGICPDSDKTNAVQHFPRPTHLKDLRNFFQ